MDENKGWVKIYGNESWHIAKDTMDADGFTVIGTLCGLVPRNYDFRPERPGHEKTCEGCLRLKVKD